jgi:hypothetical protein
VVGQVEFLKYHLGLDRALETFAGTNFQTETGNPGKLNFSEELTGFVKKSVGIEIRSD